MTQKKITPTLKSLLVKNKIADNDPLIQGFLKRYPKWDEEYYFFLTWGMDIEDSFRVFNFNTPEDNTLADVTHFYFNEVFTIIGPQPFYSLSHYEDIITYWIDGLAKDFLADTYNFILTGKRTFSIPVWESMLTQEVADVKRLGKDYNFNPDRLVTCSDIGKIKNLTPSEFFLKWIRQRDGVQDLLMTHKLFLQTYM